MDFFEQHLPILITSSFSVVGSVIMLMTYLWGFAMSLDDMPRLVEKFSELKDIGKRVEA